MSDVISRLNTALSGRYRLERQVGEGGMATVYLAEDVRHRRKVALKVLKPELAAVVGAERFLAEIETTAKLQHPHILPLFDSGEADTFIFYVMPYVEGESLRGRLDREHQLPVDESIRIATNVAEALDYAHRHGVIHRDIKPANILLLDGKPVIADFGIALAVSTGGAGRLTETGLSLGTPHYMSPEQATGDQSVGAASDLWALGCVLHEMLVGEPPFTGSTPQAVLGKIITAEPPSATHARRSVPANVDAAVRKALEKLPADRFRGADEFIRALAEPAFRHGAPGVRIPATAVGSNRAVAAAAAIAAVMAVCFVWALLRPPAPQPVIRQVLSTDGLAAPIGRRAALAPDGSSMLLPIEVDGQTVLGLKVRGSADISPIPDTENVLDVAYSPDGQWILYATPGELRKRPTVGGSAVTLASDLETGNRVALDWLDDGTILYERQVSTDREIVRISDAGEPLGLVWPPEGEFAPIWVQGLPGSRGALLIACERTVLTCDGSRSQVYAIDLRDLSFEVVLEQALAVWYVPTGHLVTVNADGAVLAVPFDVDRLRVTGGSIPLFEGVRLGLNFADLRLGSDGTLLYVEGGNFGVVRRAVWVDRDGRAETIAADLVGSALVSPTLSTDDRRLALTHDGQVWVKELPDGAFTRITNEPATTFGPVWSRDGATVAYRRGGAGNSYRNVRSDGSSVGDVEVLYRGERLLGSGFAFTPDERGLVLAENGIPSGRAIKLLDLETDSVRTLTTSDYFHDVPTLSPDGRWLAYVSNEIGETQVFVRPFPATASARTQVSTNGGREPVWAHNGRELFYREPPGAGRSGMWVAHYTATDRFEVQRRQRLFDADAYLTSGNATQFDISNDDQRFAMISLTPVSGDAEGVPTRLILVQNWFEELKRLVTSR